eukprot:6198086-Pleurochrysis_carterae.AAC.3
MGGDGLLLGTQLSGLLIILIWVLVNSLILFSTLHFTGIFRVPAEVEDIGLDVSKHGGSAYPGADPPFNKDFIVPEQKGKPETFNASRADNAPAPSSAAA